MRKLIAVFCFFHLFFSLCDAQSVDNKKAGEQYLTLNASKEGVVTLPSGLQYKIIKKGNGKTPRINDNVVVDYTGYLIDGTKFDSSVDRGELAIFPLKSVIPGWTEALLLMPVGSKWIIYVPQYLAYGSSSPSPDIPPFSTLIFEVELLNVR
jgi:FKBP-type peptidyl-prolyl cis-trans isomerase FklB